MSSTGTAHGSSSVTALSLANHLVSVSATGSATVTATGVGYTPQLPARVSIYEVYQVVNLVYPNQ